MKTKAPHQFAIITLLPEMFTALEHGVIGRSLKKQATQLHLLNPRDYADNAHGYIDDTPYGGGPGMIMQAPPLFKCMAQAQKTLPRAVRIAMSPVGQPLTQALAQELANLEQMIIVCGRYEGIDQRFIDHAIDLEISIGDFILSGGEIAAMALIDACIRLHPGALGDPQSARQDSFSDGLLESGQYTRPKKLENMSVPSVLLSGNHEAINRWRRQQSLGLTWQRRPELIKSMELSEQDLTLLEEFKAQVTQGDQSE